MTREHPSLSLIRQLEARHKWEQETLRAEVERLKAERANEARVYHETQWRQLKEAQADNEQLRAEKEMLRKAADADGFHRVLAARDAEIERLRAALGELLSGHDNLYIAHFGPGSNPHDDIAAKPARAALEPGKKRAGTP